MDTLVSILVVVAATAWAVRRAVRRPDCPSSDSDCASCCRGCPGAASPSQGGRHSPGGGCR